MKSFCAAIYCTLFFGFLSAQVQYHEQAGNLPLNSVRNLMILSTKNFEIAYDAQYEPLAKLTAQYAEAAYFDLSLSKNWDSRLKTKARINLFPNFWEYQAHFTSFQPGLYKNNVTFGHHRNVGFAYFTGDRASFYAQIRYLISKFLIYDQLLGKSNLNFQNNLLLYLPDWFVEGAAYFMSEGWNEKDEVLMKQIQPNQWEELLMKPSNALTIKTLRKSFWYFIAKEWKKEKINEIFYMTRLTRSIEGGLLTVLGQTHKTIMTRWIAFCETFYTFDSNFPQPIFQLKKNQRILGWDANDKLIVGLIEQNAFVYPFVYEIQSQKFNLFTTKKLHMYLLPDFELQLPVKMNSKGTFFIFPDFKKSVQLFKFDLQNYKIENLTTDKNLDGFNQFYPFPNSDDFVISAYQQGNSDLWLLKANGKLEQLTKTPYIDELYPVVYDENTIFTAASLVDTSQKTFALLDVQNAKSLLKLHLDTKKTDVVLTAYEYTYIPVARLNQFLVLKNSNTFPTQLMALQFPQKNFIYITNSPYGIYEVVVHENKSFQSFFLRSQYVITELNLPMDTLKTPKLSDKRTFSLSNLWQEELKQRKSYQHLEEVLQHDTTEINEIPTEDKNKVKYYVFDEGDTVKVISKQKKRKSKKEHVKYDELFFNLERVQMKDIEKHALTPIITKVNITFDLDPIYRLGIKNELFLKDSRNRKELRLMFTPYLKDFHSSFHQIEYKQRWSKYQWNLNFYKQSNFFKDPFFIRYNHATLSSGITRFFSIYDQLKFEIQATRIARYDLRLIDNRALNGKTWNNQLVLRYEFKKLETHQNYIYQGNHLIFNNLTAYPWRDKNYSFTNFELDYRNYFALGHIVFASRIRGAFSLGRVRPHYFLGGWEQWLNAEFLNKKELPVGSSLERFYYTRVVPLKGFAYNARNGTQFLMVSSEMRIPTSRILKRPTSGVPLYNFQWIIFGEIGTAWTTGNPFSQKNPIDAKTIERPPLTITVQSLKSPFIASIGMGVKFNVLGFPIRFDVAAPIEDSSFTPTKLGLFLAYEF